MLNYIWGIMIIAGVVYGIITGQTQAIGEGMMDGAREAVSLAITMFGIMGMWCGLIEIANKSGLMKSVTKMMTPFVSFLFPNVPKGHKAFEYISINFVSNIFGLSGASTPSGIKAMEYLGTISKSKEATNEMCTFLVINISSLQLIPINIVAFRDQYGSVSPSMITAPAIIATFLSTVAGVVFCKIMCKKVNK